MCVLYLCSRMRHGNTNHTKWLKSQTYFKGSATSQAIERYFIVVLHIGKALIPGSWMLGAVHAEYVHYHLVYNLCLAISLVMECMRIRELSVQYFS